MKNIARKLSALLLVFVVSMAALCPAFAASASLPSLPSGQCVVDDANVLSSSTVQTITDLNAQLESSCSGAQIGVLTVDYTGNLTTEDYALQAFNTWGIGSASENNGVLILLVMESQEYEDGDYYLTYGDGFRNTTLESQASALAQTMEDDFVRQDYDDAVTTCAQNVAQTIADIYGVSLSGGNTNNGSYNEPAYDDNSSGGLGDILLGFVTILFTIILLIIIVSVIVYTFSGPLGGLFWCFGGPWHRGPRPPRGRRNPPPPGGPYGGFGGPGPYGGRGPRSSPPPRRTPPRSTPPRSGGFGGGSFGGGSFGGGSFGGMGGGSSHGGGGGRGR